MDNDVENTPCVMEIKGLCYSYLHGEPTLKDINMSFKKGSITGVLGGNGAGKSTLFLNMNGVLSPDEGEVLVNGVLADYSKKGLMELRRQVGLIFQDPNDQLFAATVMKDVAFGVLNMGFTREEAEARAVHALEKTGLLGLKDTPIHFLSFGQKKRAAIAGVLAMEPEVVILDEPTAGLDPKGVNEVLQLLETICEDKGVTVIIATHDMDLVPLYCDYVYVMDNGGVVESGTPHEIFLHGEKLRRHSLRLPRISHLMEILGKFDNLDVNSSVSTISTARKAVKRLIKGAVDKQI